MSDRRRDLEKHLFRTMERTVQEHGLLGPGDRVMVAVSGGKDSFTMLHLLMKLVPRLSFPVELIAVHLDQAQPGYDGRPLEGWLEQSGVAFEILREDTYSEVIARTEPGGTYCAVCSRLRRGILYTAAARLGCTAIALGHHRDDALETFLLNLFFSGKLQAMPAGYTTDDDRFRVIRPLIECDEERIAEYAALAGFPILPCNLCGSQDGLQRDQMAALLRSLEASHPHVRSVMMNALSNVRPTHLLDREVREAWLAHRAEAPCELVGLRPGVPRPAPVRTERYEGKPVRTLPITR